jgi:hypothetical protein
MRISALTGRNGPWSWPSLVSVPVLVLAMVAAGAGAGAASASAATPAGTAGTAVSATCRHATGPFRVSGTKVRGSGGRVFVPYGITVPGLANQHWTTSVAKDLAKIRATAKSWCANTVRLQVAQDNLIGDTGHTFMPGYLAAIKREVALAERHHLVVVLNDQTETAPESVTFQKGPTPGTEKFWKDLIPVYGSARQVIFDLFNEPRTFSTGMSQAQEWALWHSGGTFDGSRYIGMAKLAADLRAAGARNLFWAEGPDFAASFAGMERQHALLTSPNIVYAIHHPAGGHNTSRWFKDFGYLINTGVAPVVDGEWTNYRPFGTPNAECWNNAPRKVPVFLKYLADHGVGMTAYQLAAGLLVRPGSSSLADPTTISARTWTCAVASGPTSQGAGAQILRWYRQHNS